MKGRERQKERERVSSNIFSIRIDKEKRRLYSVEGAAVI